MDLLAIVSAMIIKHLFDSDGLEEKDYGQDYWN
jgi:hypothetical protein